MGIVKEQSIKGSLVTYLGVIIGAFNVFFVFPYFLKPETIGLLKSLEAVGLLVVPFIYLGIPYAINKFYPTLKRLDETKFKILLSKSILFLLTNTVLLTILFFLFRHKIAALFIEKSPLLSKWILMSIPVFVGMSWMIVFSAIAASNLRIAFPKLMERVLLRLLHISIILLFFFAVISEVQLIVLFASMYVLPSFFLFAYVLKRKYIVLDKNALFTTNNFDFSEQKSYAFFMSISTLGTSIISHVGMIIVSSMLGLELAGIFFIAFYMGFILDVPATNFSAILRPVLANSLALDDLDNVHKLYKKSSIVQFLISGFLLLLLTVSIDQIFQIMPNGDIYNEGKFVVLIVALGYVLKNLAGCHFDIMIMSKYYRFSVFITLGMSLFTILFYYLFINHFGLIGAAIAAATTTTINAMIFSVFIFSFYKIAPFSIKTVWLILIFLVVGTVSYFLPEMSNPFLSIIIKSSILLIIFLILIYIFKISEDVSQALEKLKFPFKSKYK